MNLISLFASTNGRITRTPYWLGILVLVLAWPVLSMVAAQVIIAKGGVGGVGSASSWLTFGLIVLVAALIGNVLSLVAIPLVVKRLHDRDKSGHYVWLIYGSSVLAQVADFIGGDQSRFKIHLIAAVLVQLWFFVELGFFRGTHGPNYYGADPLEGK